MTADCVRMVNRVKCKTSNGARSVHSNCCRKAELALVLTLHQQMLSEFRLRGAHLKGGRNIGSSVPSNCPNHCLECRSSSTHSSQGTRCVHAMGRASDEDHYFRDLRAAACGLFQLGA